MNKDKLHKHSPSIPTHPPLPPNIIVRAHLINFLISFGSTDLKDSTNPSLNNFKKTKQIAEKNDKAMLS